MMRAAVLVLASGLLRLRNRQDSPANTSLPTSLQKVAANASVVRHEADPQYDAWVASQLPLIPVAQGVDALLQGLAMPPIPGLILEFGVFTGKSINTIAAHRGAVPVYGFDSFEGLPGDWRPGFGKGMFDVKGQLPPVAANVELVKGWFDETLPPFLETHPGPVSFLHVDCDMYSSTKVVLQNLAPRIVPGTVIVFDELVNYPEFAQHEMKSWYETLLANPGRQFKWIGAMCPVVPNGLSAVQGPCCSVALLITA
jgi:predicted O-methyltransferase YrrM